MTYLFLCLALLFPYTAIADDLRLTDDERRRETERLTSLGLKLPDEGLLLREPFAQPLTKRSFLVPGAWWRTPQPTEIPADRLRQDLSLLHIIMEKAYGGWDSAARRGWNWNDWFADWDRALAARGDGRLTLAAALEPFERLERFQLDNHSGPVGGPVRLGSGSRTAVLESAPTGTCTQMKVRSGDTFPLHPEDAAQRPHPAKIARNADRPPEDGFSLSYPARRGPATAIQCGGKWIPLQIWADSARNDAIAALALKPPGVPSYRTVSEAIGYLRLPEFSKENGERFLKLLPALPTSAGKERLLIVDARQNGGGDAPIDSLGRWIDVAALDPVLKGNHRQPKSCVYAALRWGYSQISSLSLTPPLSDSLRSELQQELDDLFHPAADGCPVTVEEQHSAWDYRQHMPFAPTPPGRPRLMLLIDAGCGSDCELLAYVLGSIPGTVVVGENTYGVVQFIQPGYFILPHSRLHFRIALGMSDYYGDGRSLDGYGMVPDIVLAGEDAHHPETILKLAESLLPPSTATRP